MTRIFYAVPSDKIIEAIALYARPEETKVESLDCWAVYISDNKPLAYAVFFDEGCDGEVISHKLIDKSLADGRLVDLEGE